MIIKRKLFSFIDQDGNLGYYLYNEATGEEKLFSVVEEEREFARGTKEAGKKAAEFLAKKGNKIANKIAKFHDTRHYKGELNNVEDSMVKRRILRVGEKLGQAKTKGDLKAVDKIMDRYDHGLVIPVIEGRAKASGKPGLDYLEDATYVKNRYTPKEYTKWRKWGHKYYVDDLKKIKNK